MAKKTKRIGKRTLAILLVMIMAFSLLQIGTLAADMNCGQSEHSHSDGCYTLIEHEHGDETGECYSDHVHSGSCPGVPHECSTETCAHTVHEHSESCYVPHAHGEGCYTVSCGSDEHRHSPRCRRCELDEHSHGEACYSIVCELEGTDEQVCGLGDGEIIYACNIIVEYPDCPARDFSCPLKVGENTVNICGVSEHSHSKACYPSTGRYHFDHIDIRIETGDYTLSIGGESHTLTIAFSGDANDTFSITVPGGDQRDDGKTLTLVPELQHDEGANVGEFGLKQLELANYHSPEEFSISGTVLVPKSQVDTLPEVLRTEFENLPTAEYTADQVHSGKQNDGGTYYRLTLNNYHPTGNTCTGTPTGMLNHSRKGYDFEIHPLAVLTPITDFVVVNKVVVDETGKAIADEQSFDFALGNISGSLGKVISLRGGESGSFSDLASGLYTVTETPVDGYKPVSYNGQSWDDTLYVQEVQSVSKIDGTAGSVTFYNMKLVDKGALKLSKSVTGTAAAAYNGRYSFEVKDASGATVASIVLANGQSQEIIVPAGSYTVTETGAVANGTDILTVSANQTVLTEGDEGYTANVTVGKAESVNLVFNNNYDAYVEPPVNPPVEPQTEEWTIIHNYYLDGSVLEGSVSSTVEVEVGQQPEYERVWYYEDEYYTALGVDHVNAETRTVTMDYTREYYAPSTPVLYPVSYEYTGDVPALAPVAPETVEYEEGTEVIVEENPTLEGYTFSGWDKDNFTMPAEPVVIYGSWTAVEQPPVNPDPPAPPVPVLYPVSYEYTGNIPENAPAVPATVEYEEGAAVTVAAAPVLEGYTFSGWDKGDFEMPAEAVVIYGEWTAVEQPPVNPDPPVNPPYIPPYIPPVDPPAPPVIDIPEEETPLVDLPDEETPLEELPDEDVPLADVPKTGDAIGLYVILSLLSAFGLAALSFSGKKLRRSNK